MNAVHNSFITVTKSLSRMNSLYWHKINFNGNICCTKIILPVFILMTHSISTTLFKAALSSCEIPHSLSSNESWNKSA